MLTESPQTATIPPEQPGHVVPSEGIGDRPPARPPLEQKLEASWPSAEWGNVAIVVAVSGGADSVALLRGLRSWQTPGDGSLVVAHFNHRLRGAAADSDEAFVGQLCRQFGIACELGRAQASAPCVTAGDGVEAAARDARYEFLRATAERLGARFVATAHTADDQSETILHRILRGTGLSGLAGIPRIRQLGPAVTLIRPLLEVRRCEIAEYLRGLGQEFQVDATNVDSRFTRNRIRHELLPQLARDFNPQVSDALLRLGSMADAAQQVIRSLVAPLRKRALRQRTADRVEIDCPSLADVPSYLVCELFVAVWNEQDWPAQDMTFAKWEALATLTSPPVNPPHLSPPTAAILSLPGGLRAERREDRVLLIRCLRDAT